MGDFLLTFNEFLFYNNSLLKFKQSPTFFAGLRK